MTEMDGGSESDRVALAHKLHEAYISGAHEAGWQMKRMKFEEMDSEEQTVMLTMADELIADDEVTIND